MQTIVAHPDSPTPASREAIMGLLSRGWNGAQRTAVHRAFSSVLGPEDTRTHFDFAEELNQAISNNDRLRPALQARDHEALARVYMIAINAADRIRKTLLHRRQEARDNPFRQHVLVVTRTTTRSRPKELFKPTNRAVIIAPRGWSLQQTI